MKETNDGMVSLEAVKAWILKWRGYLDEDMISRMTYKVDDISVITSYLEKQHTSYEVEFDNTVNHEFVELMVRYPLSCNNPEYNGKPYYSIKYRVNGQEYVGYSTYKLEVLSQYLKEYFLYPAYELKSCDDAISRQAAKLKLTKIAWEVGDTWGDVHDKCVDCLDELPSVMQKSKTGHWIDIGSGEKCSECHEIQYGYDNHRFYCGNCGCRMVEPQESEGKE